MPSRRLVENAAQCRAGIWMRRFAGFVAIGRIDTARGLGQSCVDCNRKVRLIFSLKLATDSCVVCPERLWPSLPCDLRRTIEGGILDEILLEAPA